MIYGNSYTQTKNIRNHEITQMEEIKMKVVKESTYLGKTVDSSWFTL